MDNKKLDADIAESLKKFLDKSEVKETINKIEGDDDYSFKVVVTTEWLDRDKETLKADGIEFKNYLKNPVVLADHIYRIDSIVGKTTKIYQEGTKTIAEWVFAKGVEKAEILRTLYNQGMVKTVSIWFIPNERDPKDNATITKSEMLEFSFVAVPANPEAISLDGKTYQKALDLWIIEEEELDKGNDMDIMEELKEVKNLLIVAVAQIKVLTDDKVKRDELESARKAWQAVANKLNEALRVAKEAKKSA